MALPRARSPLNVAMELLVSTLQSQFEAVELRELVTQPLLQLVRAVVVGPDFFEFTRQAKDIFATLGGLGANRLRLLRSFDDVVGEAQDFGVEAFELLVEFGDAGLESLHVRRVQFLDLGSLILVRLCLFGEAIDFRLLLLLEVLAGGDDRRSFDARTLNADGASANARP